jgi:hypothetical protein
MAAQSTPTDFVMIDTEHSATNVRALENLIRTAEAAGVILYVHVPDLHSEVDIPHSTGKSPAPRKRIGLRQRRRHHLNAALDFACVWSGVGSQAEAVDDGQWTPASQRSSAITP